MADIVPFPRAPRPTAPEPLWRELLGDQLRRRRHDRAETLTETADRAGVSPQYLSEVERGLKEPSSEMIAAIAGALDTSLIDLTSAVADDLRETAAPASAAVSATRGAFALAA
ncbi:helix-turn-helix domain-containing protein [Microbacterium sp. 1.5R]|uniref:helix-turn-helix domain-containing protein n=1 Tax=Microbacterium sp. 1.5R TaxID=1916917 RepID=UPI0011A380CF|nr:helix-turn-helix transcriptional regulator [Microbacterium sp. 1.5R]